MNKNAYILRALRRPALFRLLAFILALNYWAFRTEIFDDEYRENHPAQSGEISFTQNSLNWETFDKDNAPKAFTVRPDVRIIPLGYIECPVQISDLHYQPVHPIRDKSPPLLPS